MINVDEFRIKLIDECKKLEQEISLIARKDPKNWRNWLPSLPPIRSSARADKSELADRFEDFEERRSTQTQLQIRLNNVKDAITKIKNGTYGICENCKEEIGEERLKANPAATTCIKHTK